MTAGFPSLAAVASGLLALLSAVLPVLSAMVERSGPIRLRHWAEEAGGSLRRLFESPVRFEAFRLLLSWVAKLAPVGLFLAARELFGALGWPAPTAAAAGVVGALLAVVEMISRVLVARDPEAALRRLTGLYRAAHLLLRPVILPVAPLMPALALERREDEDEVTDNEIEAFINVGTQEGILEPGEEDLILRVIDFGDTLVKSVVTPRIDMVCAPLEIDFDELAELFLDSKHSRIPIYRDSVDHIVGVLHIRDLLRGLRSATPLTLEELVMAPYFVPETKPLNDLLREFQAQRQQVAIVVDEYGGTSGMVTVEDLLEEIVGEIADEHEEEPPIQEPLPEGGWRIDGRVSLEILDKLFATNVEEEPYETVGGLIFGRLGYVPGPGEQMESHGLVFQVERVEGRRIASVVVSPVQRTPDSGDD